MCCSTRAYLGGEILKVVLRVLGSAAVAKKKTLLKYCSDSIVFAVLVNDFEGQKSQVELFRIMSDVLRCTEHGTIMFMSALTKSLSAPVSIFDTDRQDTRGDGRV